MQIERFHVGEIMSQMVAHGDTLYLAGQVAEDPAGDVKGQTAAVLGKIDALLKEAGTNKTRILSATVYLSDISKFGEMNEAWKAWAPVHATPARATVEAKLADPKYLVEIVVVAAR